MLVDFPKGGLRLGGLPLTWGYLLLFLSVVCLLPYRMLAVRAQYVRRHLAAFAFIVPFFILFFYSLIGYGVSGKYFLPVLFLWFYPPMLSMLDRERVLKCLHYCVFFAAIYGIFQFFWRPVMGYYIQIPFLTSNGDDILDLATTHNNARGYFFKLISTYNNGNLYGAATLIVLRLYDLATPKAWQRWTLRLALVLTLSRTIWAGLVINELLSLGAVVLEQAKTFPRIRLGRAAKTAIFLLLMAPFFVFATKLVKNGDTSFLLDPTLGGRTGQFQHLGEISFFPTFPSQFMFTEVIYLSAINLFGYVGFICITLILLSPVGILLIDKRALADPVRRTAFKGLILYALICTSDGAIDYIPISAFYWFAYMIFLFGLPGSRQAGTAQLSPVPAAAFNVERLTAI